MGYFDKEYYIDGKKVDLPRASYRYITKPEFKRAMDVVIKNLRLAIERIPEVEQIIRGFDGRPAKVKFGEALAEKGFTLEGRSIYMKMSSNCVLSDDGKEVVAATMLEATRFDFERGITICDYIKLDEEDLIDAERTLADTRDEDNMSSCVRTLKRELEDLTHPDADKWIDKMFKARELLREIHRDAPEELQYRLFGDVLDDAGNYA